MSYPSLFPSSPVLTTYSSASNLMDKIHLPDSEIQALIPSSGTSSVQIPMLNPGYLDPTPSAPHKNVMTGL